MARLNRNWMNNDRISHNVRNAKGLRTMNTQEAHDALIKVAKDSGDALQASQFVLNEHHKQLALLWDRPKIPKWIRQPFYKFNDDQIKTLFNQSIKQGVPVKETLSGILIRDKKWALLTNFYQYQLLIESNPIKAVDQRPRLQSFIDENNNQNEIIIHKAYQSLSGFERLREISKSAFRRIQNLNGGSNRSKCMVNVDFDAETNVAENAMKDSDNAKNNKDNDLEK